MNLINSSTQDPPLTSLDMIIVFISFFVSVFLLTGLKKLYYYFFKKKKYYIFPRTSIMGISSIAMTMALCVVVLILISIVTSNVTAVLFRTFPGSRVTIESILIKIGGLIFGPFIGFFIGTVTDLLTVALTAGVFHYGYFMSAMAFGLIGGIVKVFINKFSKKEYKFILICSIALIVTGLAVSGFVIYAIPYNEPLNISFIVEFKLYSWYISFFILIATILAVLIINSFYLLSRVKKLEWFRKHLVPFCSVVTLVFLTEIFVNVFMMPVFDKDLSVLSYTYWVAIRGVLFVPMVILNILIIWPVYELVNPLVRYNYEDDVIGKDINKIYFKKIYI